MIRGLYIGASGMLAEQFRIDAISNNLANLNTPGYKRDVVSFSPAPETGIYRLESSGGPEGGTRGGSSTTLIGSFGRGVFVEGVAPDFLPGTAGYTGNALDLYVESGCFVVNTPDGEFYTRAGNFRISADGLLVDGSGNPVMGESGEIAIPEEAPVVVDEQGRIYAGERYLDRLRIVDFENPNELRKMGNNLIQALQGSNGFVPDEFVVKQGYLESSNVNPVTEMVDLIAATRSYEASQKVIQVEDEAMEKAVNEIARL